ncbi:hypothetical protein B4109_1143 [Geobacillus stearothermophilus]|uniref:Uncharacterized protein n=1 Tax=Geobacillus stearothermophilus TaxID=1422 RepID=A0A150M773_GEOSE|nr:hypothetical protein B4109_1143 [Geobacillus stearothermophilus]
MDNAIIITKNAAFVVYDCFALRFLNLGNPARPEKIHGQWFALHSGMKITTHQRGIFTEKRQF